MPNPPTSKTNFYEALENRLQETGICPLCESRVNVTPTPNDMPCLCGCGLTFRPGPPLRFVTVPESDALQAYLNRKRVPPESPFSVPTSLEAIFKPRASGFYDLLEKVKKDLDSLPPAGRELTATEVAAIQAEVGRFTLGSGKEKALRTPEAQKPWYWSWNGGVYGT